MIILIHVCCRVWNCGSNSISHILRALWVDTANRFFFLFFALHEVNRNTFKPLILRSDQHFSSPHNITSESHI